MDPSPPSVSSSFEKSQGSDIHLARVFFSATSIYLSGVFDYDILHWETLGITDIPALTEDKIQAHVAVILEGTSTALSRVNLSTLLFLFPLRIAGARSWDKLQRDHVKSLLVEVEIEFAVAETFRTELGRVWQWMDELPS